MFHHDILREVVNEEDAEALVYLSDIKVAESSEQDVSRLSKLEMYWVAIIMVLSHKSSDMRKSSILSDMRYTD